MTSARSGSDALIESAFRSLEETWEDDAAHRRFLALCTEHDALAQAGKHYRAVRDGDPARRAEAERRLAGVLAAAMARLDAARPARPRRRSRLSWLLAGVLLVLVWAALRSVLLHLRP